MSKMKYPLSIVSKKLWEHYDLIQVRHVWSSIAIVDFLLLGLPQLWCVAYISTVGSGMLFCLFMAFRAHRKMKYLENEYEFDKI